MTTEKPPIQPSVNGTNGKVTPIGTPEFAFDDVLKKSIKQHEKLLRKLA